MANFPERPRQVVGGHRPLRENHRRGRGRPTLPVEPCRWRHCPAVQGARRHCFLPGCWKKWNHLFWLQRQEDLRRGSQWRKDLVSPDQRQGGFLTRHRPGRRSVRRVRGSQVVRLQKQTRFGQVRPRYFLMAHVRKKQPATARAD